MKELMTIMHNGKLVRLVDRSANEVLKEFVDNWFGNFKTPEDRQAFMELELQRMRKDDQEREAFFKKYEKWLVNIKKSNDES